MTCWKKLNDSSIKAVEKLLNNTLQYDPATLNKLNTIEGKIITVECVLPNYVLLITVKKNHIDLQHTNECKGDTHIKGSLIQLLQLLIADNKNTLLMNSDVEINGDIQLAGQLQNILRDLDIDWEAIFATIMGDVGANTASGVIHKANEFQRHATKRCFDNMGEYLQEETRVLPSRHELELFYQQVDDIRLHTDRLQARIQALATSLNKDNPK